jgi:hypothetical protein
MFNIFDHPWGIITIAFIVFLLTMLIAPLRTRWQLWLIPPALILAAFALDHFFESDREKILALLQSASQAAEAAKPEAIAPLLADDYRDSCHVDRAAAVQSCRSAFSNAMVEQAITRLVSADIAPDGAAAKIFFTSRVVFDKQSAFAQYYKNIAFFEFQASLRKAAGRWRITSIEVIKMDGRPVSWRTLL